MAKLTAKEAKLLKALQAKSEAPDDPPVNRVLNVSVDLGDEKQVARAMSLGLLGAGDVDDDEGDEDNGDEDDDEDEGPRRRGYFNG